MFFVSLALLGLPLPVAILAGMVVSAAAVLVFAPLLLRLKGPHFAIGTWVMAELCMLTVANMPCLGGGFGMSLPANVAREIATDRAGREAVIFSARFCLSSRRLPAPICSCGRVARPGDPTVFDRFVAEHPSAKQYLDTPKPAPRSYLSERYFGINVFKSINAEGLARFGRYRIDPAVAEPHLDDAERVAAPGDFLADDLRSRLLAGPVTMRLMLKMARAGDDVADGLVSWPRTGPDAREEIELGTITLTDVVEPRSENERMQADLYFSPGRLVDGIARSRIYEMAFARRRSGDIQPTAMQQYADDTWDLIL